MSALKILLDPIYTNKSLKRCTTWYAMKCIGEYVLKEFPDAVVYTHAPKKGDPKWEVDDFLSHERVVTFEIPEYRDRYKEYLTLKDEWVKKFAFWGEAFDWDVLITPRVFQLQNIRALCQKQYPYVYDRMIVSYDPLPLVEGKHTVTMFYNYPELQMQTIGGYLASQLVAVHSQHEVDLIMQNARTYFSAHTCRQLRSKLKPLYIAPIGIDWEFVGKKSKRKGPLNLVYTQKLDVSQRRYDKVFDAFRYAFITEGSKYTFSLMTNGEIGEIDKTTNKFKAFVEYDRPPREVFRERLKNAHVCMSWSVEEGVPKGLMEAISFGVIPVIKREKWAEAFVGKEYKWLVDTTTQAVAAIKRIEANYEQEYDEFKAWYFNDWLPRVKTEGDFLGVLKNYLISYLSDRDLEVAKISKDGRLWQLINDYCGKNGIKDFVLPELLCKMSDEGVTGQNFNQVFGKLDQLHVPFSRGTSLYESRLGLVEHFGWKDGPQPGRMIKG